MRMLLTISLLFFGCCLHLQAQTEVVPMNLQAPLLLRATKFERNFANKLSGNPQEVVIGVVYQKKSRRSTLARRSFETQVKQLSFGMPIRLVPVPLNEENALPEGVNWAQFSIAYLTPLRGVDISAITEKTQQYDVISSSGIVEYGEKGVTITFDLVQDRPKFVINRSSADAEDCDFSAQLLKLAIIR